MLQTARRLTFQGNLKESRYGWLRLTPAYSVHLVNDLLAGYLQERRPHQHIEVLDPFCGTGTTALACAEQGICCATSDINPFLLWLTKAKTQSYTPADIQACGSVARSIAADISQDTHMHDLWLPQLHQIEKWWDPPTLAALACIRQQIAQCGGEMSSPVTDLLKIAFCRLLIEEAHVSFGHQSMSFKKKHIEQPRLLDKSYLLAEAWQAAMADVIRAARSVVRRAPQVVLQDARTLNDAFTERRFSQVITSPPYPNRMSYIRELRPYMYWLGYLTESRDAGELDWQAIGGTWGCATSNLARWQPASDMILSELNMQTILDQIARHSFLLAQYVRKYFVDITQHCRALYPLIKPGGHVSYIVGNSKFYDVVLPTETLFGAIFRMVGYSDIRIEPLRKRSSKKELVEYAVIARKPGRRG
jgi:hypothetical protein